jgi:hypothetical protein
MLTSARDLARDLTSAWDLARDVRSRSSRQMPRRLPPCRPRRIPRDFHQLNRDDPCLRSARHASCTRGCLHRQIPTVQIMLVAPSKPRPKPFIRVTPHTATEHAVSETE